MEGKKKTKHEHDKRNKSTKETLKKKLLRDLILIKQIILRDKNGEIIEFRDEMLKRYQEF